MVMELSDTLFVKKKEAFKVFKNMDNVAGYSTRTTLIISYETLDLEKSSVSNA